MRLLWGIAAAAYVVSVGGMVVHVGGHPLVFNLKWLGVPLSLLCAAAGICLAQLRGLRHLIFLFSAAAATWFIMFFSIIDPFPGQTHYAVTWVGLFEVFGSAAACGVLPALSYTLAGAIWQRLESQRLDR